MTLARLSRITRQRLRAVFRGDSVDAELSRELTFHYEQLVQELVDDGLTLHEARLAARRTIGNIPLLEQQCRDHRTVGWLHDARQDAAFAIRLLRKNPTFTAVAVLSLALGIGANTALISVIDAVYRGTLPIPHDERLVVLRTVPLESPDRDVNARLYEFFEWRDHARSFDLMGVSLGNNADFGAQPDGTPAERMQGQSITADALTALDVKPLIGRLFTEQETRIDAPERVIVISHRLWRRRFGGRADVIGQQVRLDRLDRTVIGVMPDGFRYPSEVTDYWIPLGLNRSQFQSPQRFFVVTARLKPGVSIAQAQADMDIVAARLARDDPDRYAGWGIRVKPLREAMFGWARTPVATLGAAVALVLLVACANVAGMLLARGLARSPEIAVRTALGASRGRLVRQLVAESLVLSLSGGVLGTLVAWGSIQALVAMRPPPGGLAIPDVSLNARVLGVTAIISIATGLLFSVWPALMSTRTSPTATLKESPTMGAAGVRPRFRTGLVTAQIALTVVLLVGAGLLTRSFVTILARDLHFNPERLLTFELHVPLSDYLQRRGSLGDVPYFKIDPPPSLLLERVYRALRALPGVESVAGVSMPLLNSVVLHTTTVRLDASQEMRGSALPLALVATIGDTPVHVADRRLFGAAYFLVTPDFFTALGARVVQGRDFGERDVSTSRWVAVVNESAARLFWPGEDPLGRLLRLPHVPDERPREVVGVVRDIPLTRQGDPTPVIYASYLQQPGHYPQPGANMFGRMTFMLRTTGDPMRTLPAARHVVSEIALDRPFANVVTMEQQIGSFMPHRGHLVLAITGVALIATLLAAIGIYGVTAYSVAQRTREIGIRTALGARPHQLALLVGGRTLSFVVLGLAVGVTAATTLTRLLQSQLWGITPTDLPTFVSAIALLVLVALAAAFFPVRRAISVNPTVALRE
jgi:putative ABC transport system permease protein